MEDPLKLPQQYPSPTHDVVVVLEEIHLSIGNDLDTGPRSHEIISYHRVAKPNDIRERIQCASVVVATQCFINSESLGEAPYLKCIITPSAGINHIDVDECRRRDIRVARCEGSTSLAVPDHALSLYFATRRKTALLHNDIRTVDSEGSNSWKRQGSIAMKMQTANGYPPISIDEETVGIIGYGCIGKRLYDLCQRLGMEVLVAERKNNGTSAAPIPKGNDTIVRHPFRTVIERATVLFICCPSNSDTKRLIDQAELEMMRPELVIINVSRGDIVNTGAVVKALREQRISGAAADVFDNEPAATAEDSAFLSPDTADLNITLSPHVGYFSTKTVTTMKAMVKDHIKHYAAGDFRNFIT
ncbi:D-isomer specific 2-hydroxyacid dehydrogenase [Xylariaceae sp. FL1019]|nr:D-isomer specific 2-hydroxyacid dehydrogenase [Xylariaceae sp. FL1019]